MKKAAGIYKILNIVSGHYYIGSAVSVANRASVHKHGLERGKHHNIALQRAWSKYGPEAFKFEVIEYVDDKSELIRREQFWIDEAKSLGHVIYNICAVAGSSIGRKFSEESRKKMSISQSFRRHTDESKKKMSEAGKGKKKSEEHKQKIRLANVGKVMSDSARKKMKEKWEERKQGAAWVVNGVAYRTAIEAAGKLGVSKITVMRWCNGCEKYLPKAGCYYGTPDNGVAWTEPEDLEQWQGRMAA